MKPRSLLVIAPAIRRLVQARMVRREAFGLREDEWDIEPVGSRQIIGMRYQSIVVEDFTGPLSDEHREWLCEVQHRLVPNGRFIYL